MLAVAVEGGLFCTLRTKRCRRVRSLSPSVTAAIIATMTFPPPMVAPASLVAWWQMVGRLAVKGILVMVMAGQVVPGVRVDLTPQRFIQVEAVVALLTQGRQQ